MIADYIMNGLGAGSLTAEKNAASLLGQRSAQARSPALRRLPVQSPWAMQSEPCSLSPLINRDSGAYLQAAAATSHGLHSTLCS